MQRATERGGVTEEEERSIQKCALSSLFCYSSRGSRGSIGVPQLPLWR